MLRTQNMFPVDEMAEETYLLLCNKECRDSSFKDPGDHAV